MELSATPSLDPSEAEAVAEALESVGELSSNPTRRENAWWRAGVAEAVAWDDDYAFSPRRTRGATRA